MHDVVIVGGGVAGGYLAQRLKGLDVVVIDRERKIFPRDSGIVSTRFDSFFGKKFIKKEITEMKLISKKHSFFLNSPRPFAYVLEREDLLKYLRKTNMRYETVRRVAVGRDSVVTETDNDTYESKIVVGADGANSVVKRTLGIKQAKIFVGIMARTEKMRHDTISIYFHKDYSKEFFSWIIPENNEYGTITSGKAKDYLNRFRADMGLEAGDIYAYPVPINYTRSFGPRSLLIGDACGQVKPLTGGGIIFSMRAAAVAEKTIRSALEKQRFGESFMSQYEAGWKKEFGFEIKKQLLVRSIYAKLSDKDVDNIFRDFGPSIESVKDFDYDHFTRVWPRLPKTKLLKFALTKFPLLF